MKAGVHWLGVALLALVMLQVAAETEAKTRSGVPPHKQLFGAITGASPKADGVGGGINCAACTFLVALGEQYADIHGKLIDKAFYELCSFLPGLLRNVCDDAVTAYMPKIINAFELRQTPDRVCQELGVCTNQTCSLFPPPKNAVPLGFSEHIKIRGLKPNITESIDRFVDQHEPFFDFDKDDFSTFSTLRGTSWRGKDCDDTRNYVYPGRKNSTQPNYIDWNCNGIYGQNEKGQSLEEVLCGGTPQYGTAILGDSAAAHFHAPPQYITAADITATTYDNLIDILANEFDWPMMSATTGYTYSDWTGHPRGPVLSSYQYTRERNLCSHRDYQNIGVNGARTSSMANSIMYGFHRDQKNDFPVMLEYALVGNDVCNSHPGLGHMTTPQEFYDNVVLAMNYLDTILPAGSFVAFMGLAEGRVLWDAMHDRIHPIGKLRNDVTYADLYDYLNCLEISPCWGWLNSDSYWRNQTSYRAFNLSLTYLEVIKNNHYKNFNMTYTNCPVEAIIDEWINQGGEAWELIEPVDGFHPNQIANALIAQHQWKLYQDKYPYLIPPINPNNDEIKKLFGDQGGY